MASDMPYKLQGERKYINHSKWQTELDTPCSLLMPCTTCGELKAITDFYPLPKAKSGRKDILSITRKHRCRDCERGAYITLDPRRKLLYPARKRAKQKGLECNIQLEDIVIPDRCPVLGIALKSNIGAGAGGGGEYDYAPTLDRIDNSRGYTKDNICVISRKANSLKGDASIDEIKAILTYMSLCVCGSFKGELKEKLPLIDNPLDCFQEKPFKS